MGKVSKVNVAAAKAQRDILLRDGKPVPRRIEIIASYRSEGTLATKVDRGSARASGDTKFRSAINSRTAATSTERE